jgi:hypothetical protein
VIACMIPDGTWISVRTTGIFAYIRIPLTRLGTRTKECNACASVRVLKSRMQNESVGEDSGLSIFYFCFYFVFLFVASSTMAPGFM